MTHIDDELPEFTKLKKTIRMDNMLVEKMIMFMTTVQTARLSRFGTYNVFKIGDLPLYKNLKSELEAVLTNESRRG